MTDVVIPFTGWGRDGWNTQAWNEGDVVVGSATGGVGSVTVNYGVSVTATGVAGTGSPGAVTVNFGSNVSATGISGTGSVGSVTITEGEGVDVSVTGVYGTGETSQVLVWGQITPSQTPSWSAISPSQNAGYTDIAAYVKIMASTYTTNLGIEKIGTGEQSGTWGGTTNTNWDLMDEAVNGIISVTLSSAGSSGSPTALPITDGASSNGRNKFIEFADGGDLGGTAYVQLTPNDAEKIVFFRNSLTSSRSVIVFQGNYSASNDFEIPNGKDVVLKFNGGGTGATVTQVLVDLNLDGLTVGFGAAADTKIVYDGNAKDFYVGLDDSADKLVIGEGSTVGTNSILTLDDDSVTVGDGAAVDTKVVFDGNAQDYYIGLDDSADDLVIGLGSTVGTTPAIEIDENQDIKFAQSIGVGQAASSTTGDIVAQTMSLTGTTPTLTIGDAGAEDTKIVFDGNAKDFYIGLDDSADKLVIGEGSTVGTTSILTITDDTVTLGDAAATDSKLVFDGNAQDFYIALDDSADDLLIGVGSTVGTTPAISIDENQDVVANQEFRAVSYNETYVAPTSSSNATTIACESGNYFKHTLTENTTFTFSNPPSSGTGYSFILHLIQDSSARTVTWPGSVDWAGGTAPTISTDSGADDFFVFATSDGGTIWYGFTAGQDMK